MGEGTAPGARGRRRRRRLVVASALAGLPLALLAVGWLWLSGSLPPDRETLSTDAVTAPVTLRRDRHGVPHIEAATLADAAFALGYAHAQDRLWQMEMMRRLGAGRLSEVLGGRTVDVDVVMRTLGLADLARRQADALTAGPATVFAAYARGVNHWLAQGSRRLPPEFLLLGHRPEPWTVADSLVWFKLIAVQLGQNRHNEALRLALRDRLSAGQLDDLWPQSDGIADPTTRPDGQAAAIDGRHPLLARSTWPRVAGASNAWIVGGTATASGKPILANDLHLPLVAPIQWYLVRIELPNGRRVGATAPSSPLLVLGHNGQIAWGITSAEIDIEDLFIEDVDADGATVAGADGRMALNTRRETIAVRGEDSRTIAVRQTRHGPLLPAALLGPAGPGGNGPSLALKATYLAENDTTPEAVYRLNAADDVDAVLASAPLYRTPPVNLFVADRAGDAAQILVGEVPRRAGGGGREPADGRTARGAWIGSLAPAPRRLAETAAPHVLSNANNRPHWIDADAYLGDMWVTELRAERLHALVSETPPATLDDAQAVQRDIVSPAAQRLLPRLLAALPAETAATAPAHRLATWSGAMARDRPEPLIFLAWLRALDRRIFADELGDLFPYLWVFRPLRLERVLTERSIWCDDVTTTAVETCPQQVRAALGDALTELAATHGAEADRWRWGDVHVAHFVHPVFDALPLVGRWLRVAIETDGGWDTINRGAVPFGDSPLPFAHTHGAGVRAVYDLGDLSRSRFILATGQSGNPLSPHYRDLLQRWRDGGWISLDRPLADVERDGGGRLDVRPAAGG